MYTQIKRLIYLYVYTIIITHIHACFFKQKRLRKTFKKLLTKSIPNHLNEIIAQTKLMFIILMTYGP